MSKGRKRFYLLNSGILAVDLIVLAVFQHYIVTIQRIFGKQNYAHQLLIHEEKGHIFIKTRKFLKKGGVIYRVK